ncbi:lytic transglycosylase domain-containing protein [Methylocaldum marinum]|uniref:lytic transglycosylase domain-containing protein n=1 Tax=Methylocaldum marinum TaxID=1432792 RepID=UPI001E35CF25|nr:transglycosylase SLT domain-containing protein [Methylocaldum marinum]
MSGRKPISKEKSSAPAAPLPDSSVSAPKKALDSGSSQTAASGTPKRPFQAELWTGSPTPPAPKKRRSDTADRPKQGPTRTKKSTKKKAPKLSPWRWAAIIGTEILALAASALVGIIAVLGRSADWFAGTGLWSNLLPFAGMVLAIGTANAVLLHLWLGMRARLKLKGMVLPAILAVFVAIGAGWFVAQEEFGRDLRKLRTLVGGMQEAERNTIAHQVFAAYRRSDLIQMQRIIERAQIYLPTIHEAAAAFAVDPEVMVGIAATESSFYPRDSKDGGRGLFQITAPPKSAVKVVKAHLKTDTLDMLNQRHNTFVAAATLRDYLAQMNGDLFLGLLAYNIGPANGGLRSIMTQYGARDFVTIQPYLKNLPRDYPIRVLTAALAYRLWHREGRLPRYEEGNNAMHIQSVGVPGLDQGFSPVNTLAKDKAT